MVTAVRLPAVARAMQALCAAEVDWAVLRGTIDGVGVEEIDLLVSPAHVDLLAALLANAGFARVPVWGHGSHRFFVTYDPQVDRWLKLDVVTRIEFASGRRLRARTTRAALDRRGDANGVARLAPADHFWAQLLHCLLDRGVVRDSDMAELGALAERGVLDGPIHGVLARDPWCRDTAVDLVASGDAAGLVGLAPRLAACLDRAGAPARIWGRLARLSTPVMKTMRRPGVTVAMLGPDGAGKSTLIASLARSFYFPVRIYHLGLYGTGRRRLGWFSRLPGVETGYQLARLWLTYGAGAYQRRRGRLVLFDRHGYEALLPARGTTSWKRRLRRVLVGRLSPAPDLVLVLDAPPHLLFARKGEHGEAALATQRAGYRRLAAWLESRGRGRLIDATRDAGTVRREATSLIWEQVVRRR
jgi:thymidylate kinase